MIKRILSTVFILLLSITLVSCIQIERGNVSYQSNDGYEQKIISASKNLSNNNVSISNNGTVIGAGVIISETRNLNLYKYRAITINSLIENKHNIKVFINNVYKEQDFQVIFKDINLDVAIIEFESKSKFKVAPIIKDNKISSIYEGQTILSVGTEQNYEYVDGIKRGHVTKTRINHNNIENYIFTHDAGINAGETAGSGVFDLEGMLVGLNLSKTYYLDDIDVRENILGLNEAIHISAIIDVINAHKDQETNKNTVEEKEPFRLEYDDAVHKVYQDAKDSVVKIKQGDKNYSGLIYKKDGNKYFALTKYFEDELNIDIIIGTDSYNVENVSNLDDNRLISILEFTSTENLNIYNNNVLETNKIEELTVGQTLVAIGSVNDSYTNLVSVGTLSKEDYKDHNLFMHDIKLNAGQEGAPIFNLNGVLLGVYTGKTNQVQVGRDEFIAAEGLGFGYNLNNSELELDQTKYESKVAHEEKIINSVARINNSVVTVRTNTGHGSGVIIKENKQRNGTYLYYVITNEHVIENVNEINIDFKDGKSIYAKDYQASPLYDVAVVRFISETKLEFIQSNVIDDKENINYQLGQRVIAIGTPENLNNNNYITTGIIRNNISSYHNFGGLAVNHDAALNPGNSGGPLFNLEGELIGINVAKKPRYVTFKGEVFSERLSIALNINTVSKVLNTSFNKLSYKDLAPRIPKIGVTVINVKDVPNEDQGLLPDVSSGVLILEIDPGYDAYGKLLQYDVIVAINDLVVNASDDIVKILKSGTIGDDFKIRVARKTNGTTTFVDVMVKSK